MIESLEALDRAALLALNGSGDPFWDSFMEWTSSRWIWIPFYLLLFILIFIQFRKRTGLILILGAALVFCTDQTANLFKNHLVQRYRPCHNYELKDVVRVNGECGGKYGFVSSHAANTFGMAVFLFLLLKYKVKFSWIYLFAWAALVSYSRIYNGVHYPADVLGGALIGVLFGWLFYRLFRKFELKLFKA